MSNQCIRGLYLLPCYLVAQQEDKEKKITEA